MEARKGRKKDDELLGTMRKRFADACQAEDENRKNYVEDLVFSSSADQWDAEVKRKRGFNRPALTFNRLNGVVKQINVEESGKFLVSNVETMLEQLG